jgi:hypothetical protein
LFEPPRAPLAGFICLSVAVNLSEPQARTHLNTAPGMPVFEWLRNLLGGARRDDGDDAGIPIDLRAIPGAIELADGLPRPQWPVIRPAVAALDRRYGPRRVWCEVQRQWLEALQAALGEGYAIVETPSVLLLCARVRDEAESLARLCENTLTVVGDILGSRHERHGKLPVFVFDSPPTYYTYVSHFYGDGEHGLSVGMCIREPGGSVECEAAADAGEDPRKHPVVTDAHVATFDVGIGLERTLAHEMVHALLRPELPAWVEEGIAEVVSRRIAKSGPLMLERADVRRQQHHWRKNGLHTFWAGESFQRGDRGQELSYALAEVLVQNLLADHRRSFRDFLDDAESDDAGDSAAREHFGTGLGEITAQFLGEGDWSPRHAGAVEDAEERDDGGDVDEVNA